MNKLLSKILGLLFKNFTTIQYVKIIFIQKVFFCVNTFLNVTKYNNI